MAYPFPATYQPYYPQYSQPNLNPTLTQPQTNQQSASSLIWVQGEAGAKSYMVAPNTTVALWDSEDQVIYLKSADASGMPSMRVLDYTICEDTPITPKKVSKTDFATKEEVLSIKKELDQIKANMSRIKAVDDEPVIQST